MVKVWHRSRSIFIEILMQKMLPAIVYHSIFLKPFPTNTIALIQRLRKKISWQKKHWDYKRIKCFGTLINSILVLIFMTTGLRFSIKPMQAHYAILLLIIITFILMTAVW